MPCFSHQGVLGGGGGGGGGVMKLNFCLRLWVMQ